MSPPNGLSPLAGSHPRRGSSLKEQLLHHRRSSMFWIMDLTDRITVDPNMCHGKPVIRGKRYPVGLILDLLAAGMSRKEILADYEDLRDEDITACLQFAAKLFHSQRVIPLAA